MAIKGIPLEPEVAEVSAPPTPSSIVMPSWDMDLDITHHQVMALVQVT